MADSGTMRVAAVLSACPPDGSRAAVRLLPAPLLPLAATELLPVLPVLPMLPAGAAVAVPAGPALATTAFAPAVAALPVDAVETLPRAGTYTSFSAFGLCAYWRATPMMMLYWFSSS